MKRSIYQHKHSQSGFTLVEVLIALVLVIFILGAMLALQDMIFNQQQTTINSYVTIDTANRTVERMAREIRNSRIADNGAYTLEILDDQNLAFYGDADGDSSIERIRYFLDGAVLKKGVIEPTSHPVTYPLANEVVTEVAEGIVNGTEPIFYYYNGEWPKDETNNPLPITSRQIHTRLIGIRLVVNTDELNLHTNYEIASYTHVRTLKDNL